MPGYPSVVVGLMVIGGVQLIMIGIMGEYIGKILSELKARPVYFVAEHSLKTADDERRAADPPRARPRSDVASVARPPPDLALRRRLRHLASVNEAIRDLMERGRINATSVMVVAPSLSSLRGDLACASQFRGDNASPSACI